MAAEAVGSQKSLQSGLEVAVLLTSNFFFVLSNGKSKLMLSSQKCNTTIKKLFCSHENFLVNDGNSRKGCEDSNKARRSAH